MRLDTITTLTFDVVGTLIDFETGIVEWYHPWLRRHRQRVDDEEILRGFAAVEDRLQRSNPEMPFTSMLPRIHDALAESWSLDSDESESLDFRDSIRDWPPFADAVAGLRTLRERFRLVAVTNADSWALEQMSRTLGEPFDEVVTCDMVGVNKPDPRVWEFTLDRLGAKREEILHCAQSTYHDLISARNFGLATAWIERRHDREGTGATPDTGETVKTDLHVHSLSELITALEPRPPEEHP
jgi:putative hydrolase of the HAD superfamily